MGNVLTRFNRTRFGPVAQIAQCTSHTSHNAPFCNRHFCHKKVALWDICLNVLNYWTIWTIEYIPAGTRRNNSVSITSKRRHWRRFDVMKALSLRHYCVMCPLDSGRCREWSEIELTIDTPYLTLYTTGYELYIISNLDQFDPVIMASHCHKPFLSTKGIWKCHLQLVSHFVQGSFY